MLEIVVFISHGAHAPAGIPEPWAPGLFPNWRNGRPMATVSRE